MGERDRLREFILKEKAYVPTKLAEQNVDGGVNLIGGQRGNSMARNTLPIGKMSEVMFPQGVVDTPFWFSNIGGNHFPREGFTYRPYDLPVVDFKTQMQALELDEDVQFALNFLASKITGGGHHWKAASPSLTDHIDKFTNDIGFDEFVRTLTVELLWAGNSFWKVRGGLHISQVESYDQLMHLPLDSMARIWWTPDRIPLWYEFRGANFNGYFRNGEIFHFMWNNINASAFGLGFATPLTARISYFEDSVDGPRNKIRESLLDMKYGTQNMVYKAGKRYVTRNVYQAMNSTPQERANMSAELADLDVGQDFVVGKQVDVKELGSAARNYNPQAFLDLVMGQIIKSLGTMRGRNAGESQHSYANADTSAELDEIGIAAFPQLLLKQLENKIFKPWYQFNPATDPKLGGGLVYLPWEECKFELHLGKIQKMDLSPEQTNALLGTLVNANAITIEELRDACEKAGVGLNLEDFDISQGIQTIKQAMMPEQEQSAPGQKKEEKPVAAKK